MTVTALDEVSLRLDATFRPRSLARRQIELYGHELQRLEAAHVRLRIVMTGTAGEEVLAQRVLDWERELIARDGEAAAASEGGAAAAPAAAPDALSRLERAEEDADIPAIVSIMAGSGPHSLRNLYDLRLQLRALAALRALCHRNAPHRARLAGCGGVPALLAAARVHGPRSPALLRGAAALLVGLPFFRGGDDCAHTDRLGRAQAPVPPDSPTAHGKRRRTEDAATALDTGIVALLLQVPSGPGVPGGGGGPPAPGDAFALIAEGVERDLFRVQMDRSGDEAGNYERLLAAKQIPHICRTLPALHRDAAGLRRRLLLLRTCLASYLGDTDITTDTLGAIVL